MGFDKRSQGVDEDKRKKVMDALRQGIAEEQKGSKTPTKAEIEDVEWMHANRPIYPA